MILYYLLIVIPLLSLASFLLYAVDKYRAGNQLTRIPEKTLLTLDAAGGWIGGLMAQQKFRHKTYKKTYRRKFILAVLVNLILVLGLIWVTGPQV